MEFTSKAKPAGKEIEVCLTEADMADVEGWDTLPTTKKWRAITDRADMLLIEYMLRRGDISQEYAEQSIRQIRAGEPVASR